MKLFMKSERPPINVESILNFAFPENTAPARPHTHNSEPNKLSILTLFYPSSDGICTVNCKKGMFSHTHLTFKMI